MIDGGLATGDEAIFDLDFHAVMHWGARPRAGKALRAHPLPTRPLRADLLRPGHRHPQPRLRQRRPVQGHPEPRGHRLLRPLESRHRPRPAHADHGPEGHHPDRCSANSTTAASSSSPCGCAHPPWSATSTRSHPATTRRSPWTGPARTTGPGCTNPRVRLTNYPGTVRQLIVTGLGRDAPTVIITNDHDSTSQGTDHPLRPPDDHRATPRRDHPRVPRRRAVLHRQPQRRPRHHALRARPSPASPRSAPACPATPPSPPTSCNAASSKPPAQIITTADTITVRLDRRAYTPVLRQADLPNDTTVPWWGNRTLRYEFA